MNSIHKWRYVIGSFYWQFGLHLKNALKYVCLHKSTNRENDYNIGAVVCVCVSVWLFAFKSTDKKIFLKKCVSRLVCVFSVAPQVQWILVVISFLIVFHFLLFQSFFFTAAVVVVDVIDSSSVWKSIQHSYQLLFYITNYYVSFDRCKHIFYAL